MKSYSKKNRSNVNNCNYKLANNIYVIPIAIIIFLIPLIVYLKVINLNDEVYRYWLGAKQHNDFFSYYKMVWFLLFTFVSILIFVIKTYVNQNKIKKTCLYIPLCIYSLFTIISAILSKTKNVSFWGFPDRYEGLFVLLGYVTILFVTLNLVNSKEDIKIMIYSLIASASIIGVIGILQYFGYDIFKSNVGKMIILPSMYEQFASEIEFNAIPNAIYGTLYHYNYLGSYMAMLFPLSLVLFIYLRQLKYKIPVGLFSLLMFSNWIACRSRAGIVGGFIGILLIIIIYRKQIIKKWKVSLICIAILLFAFVGINNVSNGSLWRKITSLYSDPQIQVSSERLIDIRNNGNMLEIITNKNVLKIFLDLRGLSFKDSQNRPLLIKNENGYIIMDDSRYNQFKLSISPTENFNLMDIYIGDANTKLITIGNQFKIINYLGEAVDIQPVKKWGFEGREGLGSARGYIWSRTIPLLRDTLIFGYGPDTFSMHFPQNDNVGKIVAYNTTQIVVDKPHNSYLQTSINTGVISLITILSLFIIYIINSIKIYLKNRPNDFISATGFGIFTAVCGYLGAAFFNDSVISVAPVFWVLLGMGISINMALRETSKR